MNTSNQINSSTGSESCNAMGEIKTRVQNGIRGTWEAVTLIDLSNGVGQFLEISTMKVSSGALVTQARVKQREREVVASTTRDFSERLLATNVRVTERAVRAQHAQALSSVRRLWLDAYAYYAPVGAWYTSREVTA